MRRRFGLALIALCAVRRPAYGLVFDVDRTDDAAGASACMAAASDCSLRGAIIAANTNAGLDTVNLPSGTYTLSVSGAAEDLAATGDLDILDDLILAGAGAATTTIDGALLDRVIHTDPVGTDIDVTISGVTIQNGKTEVIAFVLADGGAVRNGTSATSGVNNGGTLTIVDSVIRDSTTPRNGGGIANAGTLILMNSSVTGSSGENGGGLFQDDAGAMTITGCTISGNTAAQGGGLFQGAFSIAATPLVTIGQSTFSANTAPTGSGIFYNRGTLDLTNTTVSGNLGTGPGIGSFDDALTLRNCTVAANAAVGIDGGATIGNTIIAGNSGGSGADCGTGTLVSTGHNLIQTGCTISGDTTGNVLGMNPMLDALASNGGATMTHAIPIGSPALDAGDPATPGSGGTACAAADQRGVARPKPTGGQCDIGAFELDYVPTTTTSSTTTSTTASPSTTSTSTTLGATTTTTSTSSSSTTTSTSAPVATSSSTTTSTSAPVATSTSTTSAPTTTTTLPPTTCDDIPLTPPSFQAIDCRLAALLGRVQAETALGKFQAPLVKGITKARTKATDGATFCRDANLKKTSKRLKQAGKAMIKLTHRLSGLAARNKLDPDLRQSLLDDASPIGTALKAFRGTVRCPDDAPVS